MAVRIHPHGGRAGRITIDESNTAQMRTQKGFAAMDVRQYLEGDLCLTMCPGVRMVKGYVKLRGRMGVGNSLGSFEVRLDFVGWADVRFGLRPTECLEGFEVAIDFDIQLPRSKKRLKLSSASQFKWNRVGRYVEPSFKTFEPTFTHHTQGLTQEGAKQLTEYCHGLASGVKRVIGRYSEELYLALECPRRRMFQCDPKTGRPCQVKR